MEVKILNHCQKTCTPAPENTIRHIVKNIPDQYLSGLDAIHILDARQEAASNMQYIRESRQTRIEVYMDDSTLSGTPFFSIFSLNVDFLLRMNEHIELYVKTHTHDQRILRKDTTRICYDWMYLGRWKPLLILFRVGHVLLSRSQIFRKITFYFFTRFITKVHRNLEQSESTPCAKQENIGTDNMKSPEHDRIENTDKNAEGNKHFNSF